MKILFVSPVYSNRIGGRESYLYKISQELARDNEVQVVARFDKPVSYFDSVKRFSASSKIVVRDSDSCSYQHELPTRLTNLKVNIIGLNLFEKMWLLPVYKLHFNPRTQFLAIWMYNRVWIRKLVEMVKWADIVEFHGVGMELLGFSTALACKLEYKPFIVSPHAHIGDWGDGNIDISLYKKANTVIAKTNYEKQFLTSKGIETDKIKLIQNAPLVSKQYDAGYFREKCKTSGSIVLFVGRKVKGKGYDALVNAIELVWKVREDVCFVFIGTGRVKSKKDFRILELGWVDEFEKASAYAACDIFCMPSYAEAFGIVYTEAWTFGKPVIGGDIPALREVISDGVDGLLVKQDPEAIASAILKLLGNDELRNKMGREGKKKVEKYFNWDRIIAETKELYKKLV